jgi:hypothetical protein
MTRKERFSELSMTLVPKDAAIHQARRELEL